MHSVFVSVFTIAADSGRGRSAAVKKVLQRAEVACSLQGKNGQIQNVCSCCSLFPGLGESLFGLAPATAARGKGAGCCVMRNLAHRC